MEVMKENTIPNGQLIVPVTHDSDVIEAGTSGNSDFNAIDAMAKGMSIHLSHFRKLKPIQC